MLVSHLKVLIGLFVQRGHVWKVAQALSVVEPVPDREAVGNLETRRTDRQVHPPRSGLVRSAQTSSERGFRALRFFIR